MKIISNKKNKIAIEAMDIELKDLFLDYEIARRIGGKTMEVVCLTFKNEEKRDAGQAVITNVPALKMMITKADNGTIIQTNVFDKELLLPNDHFEVSEPFVEKCIIKCYEGLGYTVE